MAGRRRLPPLPTMYSATWRISTTSDSNRNRIMASTARISASIREWMGSMGTGARAENQGWKTDLAGSESYNKAFDGQSSIAVSARVPGLYCSFVSWSLHMYAVIKTGGKQYRVAAGEKLKIEQIAADIGAE